MPYLPNPRGIPLPHLGFRPKHPTWKKPGQPHGEVEFGAAPPPPVRRFRPPPPPQRAPGFLGLLGIRRAPAPLAPHPMPGTPSIQHLIPSLDQLRRMTPGQLSALYATLPPGAQIAGFPPPNAFYFPNPDGTNPATHQPHGEDAGDAASPGATDEQSPNYENIYDQLQTEMAAAADQSIADYEAGSLNAGTMQMTIFDDVGESRFDPMYWDPSVTRPDNAQLVRMAPTGYDVYDPPEQVANKRNYLASFGDDVGFEDSLYSGFGPSAIIGCDIGPSIDTELKG